MTIIPNAISQVKYFFHYLRRIVAKHYLALFRVKQIAITGSQGKTALTQSLNTLLSPLRPTIVTDTNLDTLYNVPITALRVRPWHHYVLFELGIDTIGEMDKHLDIVHPDFAVITGMSAVHSDKQHLGSEENVFREKRKLADAVSQDGLVFLNYSDKKVRAIGDTLHSHVVWFGREDDSIDTGLNTPYFGYDGVSISLQGTQFTLHDHEDGTSIRIRTKLIGSFHAQTLTTAYAILKRLNPLFVTNFADAVYDLINPLAGRMSIRKTNVGMIILDDSLRANPASTQAGLETFNSITYREGRKVAILADMGELEFSERDHRHIGKVLSQMQFELIICVGVMQKCTAEELVRLGKHVQWYETVEEAKTKVPALLKPHDFIYLKGSKYSYVGKVLDLI